MKLRIVEIWGYFFHDQTDTYLKRSLILTEIWSLDTYYHNVQHTFGDNSLFVDVLVAVQIHQMLCRRRYTTITIYPNHMSFHEQIRRKTREKARKVKSKN